MKENLVFEIFLLRLNTSTITSDQLSFSPFRETLPYLQLLSQVALPLPKNNQEVHVCL